MTAPVWTGPRPTLFVGHTGSENAVAITPDGRFAVSVSGFNGDKSIRVWDFATGKEFAICNSKLRTRR